MQSLPITRFSTTALETALRAWEGVPFRKGQGSKSGVDCIHFVDAVLSELLGLPASKYCGSWSRQAASIMRKFDLQESEPADGRILVFSGASGPHVGLLLSGSVWHASPPQVCFCSPAQLPLLRCLAPKNIC
jgi:cell wall-associated NlpC family hydrolase